MVRAKDGNTTGLTGQLIPRGDIIGRMMSDNLLDAFRDGVMAARETLNLEVQVRCLTPELSY